jgi:uncharacterized protein YkwD
MIRAEPRRPSLPLLALAVAATCFTACAGAPAPPAEPPASTARPEPPQPQPRGGDGSDAAAPLSPLEARAAEAARARLGAHAQLSGSLSAAARLLARRAARGAAEPLERIAVRDALAQAGAWDPAPAAFLARAGAARLPEVLSQALRSEPDGAFGVGVTEDADGAVAVALVVQRRARLDAFPREVKPGATAVLSGELRAGLRAPRVFVTLPSGEVEERPTTGAAAFRAPIVFPRRGRYVVEVIGEAADGPSVAALLVVSAGGASLASPADPVASDPADPAQAEAQVVAELSALRARHGLSPVVSSPELAAVARRHSAAMRAAGKVAHRLPGSPGPAERLARAGIAFQRVFENVAAAESALSAHRAAADSPAHRQNMLEPEVTRVGVGIEREPAASAGTRVYLTEILIQPQEDGDASRLTLDGRVREALWQERARLSLPPLTADAALDELAREGAKELQRADARELPDLAPRALALKRSLAASDGFVASAPREAAHSRNLADARFRRVGVGVVEGPSRRFGAGRLFIAVVYTN